ncbi:MAG: hypothetical protein WBP66_12015, partial [Azonexus sp.]
MVIASKTAAIKRMNGNMAAFLRKRAKKNPAQAGFLMKRGGLLGADDFDVGAAIRLQAGLEFLGCLVALA